MINKSLPLFSRHGRKVFLKSPSSFSPSGTRPLSRTGWSYITLSLASFCLFLIIVLGTQNGFGFISPVSSFLNPLTLFSQEEKTYKVFGYIPGWSDAKYDDVDFSGFDMLAFYDVPVKADGSLNDEAKGYSKVTSSEASDLFQMAHAHGVEVVLTISQSSNQSIERILDSQEVQERLINQTASLIEETGTDGVAIEFAYFAADGSYQKKYTDFVSKFKNSLPDKSVHVALGTDAVEKPFYNIASLDSVSDTLLFSMSEVALLEQSGDEIQAPEYTYQEEKYWEDVSNSLKEVSAFFTDKNVALEKAWYGNGDQYPMYKPVAKKALENKSVSTNTLSTPLSEEVIDQVTAKVPAKAKAAARKNLPYIAKALEDEGILTPNVLAYALATIEHETASTFEPIDEIAGAKSARRLGYEGGNNYYGRGFIQLTHLRNYKTFGERIGMGDKLARNPELASSPEVAAKILAAFFVDNGPAKLANKGDFITARRPINPDVHGYSIANIAMKYRYIL